MRVVNTHFQGWLRRPTVHIRSLSMMCDCDAKTVFSKGDRVYVNAKALRPLVEERTTIRGKQNVLTDIYSVFQVGEYTIEIVGKRGRTRLTIKAKDALKVSSNA